MAQSKRTAPRQHIIPTVLFAIVAAASLFSGCSEPAQQAEATDAAAPWQRTQSEQLQTDTRALEAQLRGLGMAAGEILQPENVRGGAYATSERKLREGREALDAFAALRTRRAAEARASVAAAPAAQRAAFQRALTLRERYIAPMEQTYISTRRDLFNEVEAALHLVRGRDAHRIAVIFANGPYAAPTSEPGQMLAHFNRIGQLQTHMAAAASTMQSAARQVNYLDIAANPAPADDGESGGS